MLGTAFLTTYQPFYLTDKLGLPDSEVPGLIFRSMLVQSSMVVALSVIGGRLSDALQRRKAFVLGGAIVYALGLWIVALADSYATFLAGMAATGIGHGLYFAVDLALVTEVLPDRERDAAKDLGILNITNALPQSRRTSTRTRNSCRQRRRLRRRCSSPPAPSRWPARSPSCRSNPSNEQVPRDNRIGPIGQNVPPLSCSKLST